MELFNEAKNIYFKILFKILNDSSNGLLRKDILKIVDNHEFTEKLIDKNQKTFSGYLLNEYDENENFNLLEEKEGKYFPKLNGESSILPIRPLLIELIWLKSLLETESINLLLDDEILAKLKEKLNNIDSPIQNSYIEFTNNVSANIENYEIYKENFKFILNSIMNEKAIVYDNQDKMGNMYKKKVSLPIFLEYSMVDKSFRVSMFSLDDNRPILANIHSMRNIKLYNKKVAITRKEAINNLKNNKLSQNPIIIEVIDKKSAMERCFMLFSQFQRTSKKISEIKYEISLNYYHFEEETIIKNILSLGPYVKVISPDSIRDEIIKRIKISMNFFD